MGTPPSYMPGLPNSYDFFAGPDTAPAEPPSAALLDSPMALRIRIEDLERTRVIDAERIAILEARLRTLETGE